MTINKISSLFLVIELLILTSCNSKPTPINIPTPRPAYDCSVTKQQPPGWRWEEITIGVSTKNDLINIFGLPQYDRVVSSCMKIYSYYDLHLTFSIVNEVIDEIDIYTDTKVSGQSKNIIWHPKGLPETLYDAKALFGEPDFVGFDTQNTRYVVWKNIGVMVLVDITESIFPEQSELIEVDYLSPQAVDRVLSNTEFGIVSEIIPQAAINERNIFDGWERWQQKRGK